MFIFILDHYRKTSEDAHKETYTHTHTHSLVLCSLLTFSQFIFLICPCIGLAFVCFHITWMPRPFIFVYLPAFLIYSYKKFSRLEQFWCFVSISPDLSSNIGSSTLTRIYGHAFTLRHSHLCSVEYVHKVCVHAKSYVCVCVCVFADELQSP